MALHAGFPRFYLLLLVLLVLSFCIPSFGQSEDATLSGIITDPTGAIVQNAQVKLTNVDTGITVATASNNSGLYVFATIHPGHYRMVVEKAGFRQVVLTDLTLNVQDLLSRNFKLQLGAVGESVTVSADGVNVNTTDASVSTVIDQKFVENMPLNGRSFQDLIALAPGVTMVGNLGNGGQTGPGQGGEFSVNGQRTEENYFTVDGVSATVGGSGSVQVLGAGYAGATPAETVLGTTQSMISVDALQEFRATTSTYSAEYGRTPGGQFALTTRPGTNAWHGTAYDYFRNDALDASNWFLDQLGLSKDKERQNDFGGTLGGPVIIPGLYNGKDKTFFFFSYEGLRLVTPQGVQTVLVPDPNLRQTAPAPLQPILNAYPKQNAGEDGLSDGFGFYKAGVSFPGSIDSTSVRIDHNLSDKLKVFGRYANTPNFTSSYFGAQGTDTGDKHWLLTVGATALISSRQSNELRFNITQDDSSFNFSSTSLGGATPFDLTSIPGPNGLPYPAHGAGLTICFCYGDFSVFVEHTPTGSWQRQYNVTDTYNWVVGRHNLKFGVDWRRLATHTVTTEINQFLDFPSEASILANSSPFAIASGGASVPFEPVYKNFSAFAEDEWKVTPRLSLSLGLRWDVNPAPGNATGPSPYAVDQITDLATLKLAPAGTPLWRTDWLGFAPRIGAAYQLHQTAGHETVVRGGFGWFYDMGNTLGSLGFLGIGFGHESIVSPAGFPLTSAQLALPPPSVAPPYNSDVYGFDPHLKLPYTLQWNVAIEQALGRNNALTMSYVGAAGRGLLATFQYAPENLGNPNFNGNVCSECLFITKNNSTSDYNSLQVQFQRRLSRGVQALASYTWSHSIDLSSNNFFELESLRASSDFDVRHNFQAALTYDVPGSYSNPVLGEVLRHWGLDARVMARSAVPVNIESTASLDSASQTFLVYNPNVVPGQPLILYGSQYPGGRILNYNAYSVETDPAGNPIEGNAGRNSARDFGAWQLNLALRRSFPIHERLRLQFRAEAFNIFNHPNFSMINNNSLNSGPCGPPQPQQSLSCFGVASTTLNTALGGLNSLYQIGGPRSLQLSLKLVF